ncbi:MAG TPA: 30S ribosomal protein S6 [Firmicutes bacterium]|nr:30S ribosomal protein S6 [Bacillota bacterium]
MAQEEIYEILYIVSPRLEEAEIEEVHKQVLDTITGGGGSVRRESRWGRRRLAYEVKKFREGYYIFVEFNGTGQTVKDLLDLIRVEGRIIRHLITSVPKAKLEEEKRREELAQKRAEEAKKQAEAARAAEEAEKAAEAARKEEAAEEAKKAVKALAESEAADESAPEAEEESDLRPQEAAEVSEAEPAPETTQKTTEGKGD